MIVKKRKQPIDEQYSTVETPEVIRWPAQKQVPAKSVFPASKPTGSPLLSKQVSA